MNWVGDLVQKELSPDDVVLDLGCGIMQSTLDTCPSYPPTRIQCRKIIGVDIYEPYFELLQKKGIEVKKWDLRDLPLPFQDKSVDVILLLDTLEHLDDIHQAEALLEESERISRKKLIVLTPGNFDENIDHATKELYPYCGLGTNPFQRHHILFDEWRLQDRGFTTKRTGKRRGKYSYVYGVKNLRLKILHVWSQAGVSGLMAQYQRRLGHEAHVVKRDISFDGLGQDRFYGVEFLDIPRNYPLTKFRFLSRGRIRNKMREIIGSVLRKYRTLIFYWNIRRISRNYDIIHVHSVNAVALFIPFKKKIIEFHGDEIRDWPSMRSRPKQWITKVSLWFLRPFVPFYVSTPDLLRDLPGSSWIPNPVDVEFFKRELDPIPGSALYCWNWYEDKEWAEKLAEKKAWDLTILNRIYQEWITYEDFPEYLGKFEYYIDRHHIPSLSKTALEALAMGLKVVRWDGRIISGLDPDHLPENVARRTIKIYYAKIYGGSRI